MKHDLQRHMMHIVPVENLPEENSSGPVPALRNSGSEAVCTEEIFRSDGIRDIHSTAPGMVITARHSTQNADRTVALCCVPNQFRKALETTGPESFFPLHYSENDAVSYLKNI